MHKYMRAIGFTKVKNKEELKEILTDVVVASSDRSYAKLENDEKIAVMSKNISQSLGISVCGEFDDKGNFVYDYHFPYLRSFVKSVEEEIVAERHSSQVSYAGVCEEINFGVVLIFYLQNFPAYLELEKNGKIKQTYVSLTGLSTNGRIIFPLQKSHNQKKNEEIYAEKRKNNGEYRYEKENTIVGNGRYDSVALRRKRFNSAAASGRFDEVRARSA